MYADSWLTLAAIAVLSLLVASCGGGSGGQAGNGPPPPPPPATGIHLSSANAPAAAYFASTLAGQAQVFASLADDARNALARNPGRSNVIQSCRFAGTETFELMDRDANGAVSPNDSIRVVYASCRNDDSTYDATFDVVFDTITEHNDETFLAGHVALDSFRIVSSDGRIVSFTGTVRFEYRFSTERDDLTVRSSAFSATLNGGTETVRNLEHRAVHELSNRSYEITLSGTVDSESLGGDFRFAATSPLQGELGQYPTSGALQFDGAGNSRVRLIEGDARESSTELTVLLIDANGDGLDEASQVAPWADFIVAFLFEGLRGPPAPPPPPPPPPPEPDVVDVRARQFSLFGGAIRDVQSDPARRRIYLSVRDHIVVLSADTYLIETQFFVGSRPTGLAMSADGSRLYVALSGGGAVSIVDLDTAAVSTVEVATEMAGAYVVDVIEARPGVVLASGLRYEPEVFLVAIDTNDNNRVWRVAGGEDVHGEPTLFASPDRRFVYVGNRASVPALLKLDALAADFPVVARSAMGAAAAQLAVSTDGTRLITGGGTIYDAETLARVSIGHVEGHVAANQDGTRLLRATDFLLLLDGTTFQTLARYRTDCSGGGFLESISAVGLRDEWILKGASGALCVFSLADPDTPPGVDGSRALPPLLQPVGVAATEYFVGPRDSVSAMALDAARGFTYVSLPLHKEVVAVPLDDAQTDYSIATPGAGQPRRMIMSPDGSRLYVALWGTGEVAVIDPDSRQVERVLDLRALLGHGNTSDMVEPIPGRLFVSASPDTGEFAFLVEVDPANPASARRVGRAEGYRQAFLNASSDHLYIADNWWPTQIEKRALASPSLDLLMTGEPQGSGSTITGRLSPDDKRLYLQTGIILSTSTLRQVGLAVEGTPRVSADGREVHLGGGSHVLTYRTDTLEWTGSVISGCVSPVFPDYAIDIDVLPDRSRFIILGSGGAVCMMDASP